MINTLLENQLAIQQFVTLTTLVAITILIGDTV